MRPRRGAPPGRPERAGGTATLPGTRGCTKPGCDAPAYHSQAHHVTAWTSTGRTDITELTLACGPDNRLAEKGWTTRKNTHGHTEWLPPPHLDHGQPRTNTFHHPERFLHNQDDDDKPD